MPAKRPMEYDCVRIHGLCCWHISSPYLLLPTLHSTLSYSSTTSTGVNVATTARWSAVGVTPTSITMRATALGMLWCSVGLHPSDYITTTPSSITVSTMLALCGSLHEYEHTNYHHPDPPTSSLDVEVWILTLTISRPWIMTMSCSQVCGCRVTTTTMLRIASLALCFHALTLRTSSES